MATNFIIIPTKSSFKQRNFHLNLFFSLNTRNSNSTAHGSMEFLGWKFFFAPWHVFVGICKRVGFEMSILSIFQCILCSFLILSENLLEIIVQFRSQAFLCSAPLQCIISGKKSRYSEMQWIGLVSLQSKNTLYCIYHGLNPAFRPISRLFWCE